MDLADMRAVLAVAEAGSTTRAAEWVHLSQPAVSRLVRRVEGSLGFRLFERSTTGLALTAAGAAFCADLANLVQQLDRSVRAAQAIDLDAHRARRQPYELRIGFLAPAAAELTRPILRAYRAAWPRVSITQIDVAPLGADRALAEGAVDVAFLWTPLGYARLRAVPLFDDAVGALLPRNHPLAVATALDEDDLAGQTFTMTTGMTERWRTASMLRPWRRCQENAIQVANVNAALAAIARGDAVSIGPRSLQRHIDNQSIVVVAMNLSGGPTSVVCSRISDHRPHVEGFLMVSEAIARKLRHLVPYSSAPRSDLH